MSKKDALMGILIFAFFLFFSI